MTSADLDMLLKAGIPAGLGVLIVVYLLRWFLPAQQASFHREMDANRAVFKDALETEQKVHSALAQQMSSAIESEGKQTRAILERLNATTDKLAVAVHKMSGVVSTFPEGRG